MTKAILIFLLIVLPWQAIAAAERNFTHVLGSGKSHDQEFVVKHIAEHANHGLHHHDADEDDTQHVDDSLKSVQHLADYEQAGSLNVLFFVPRQPGGAYVSPPPSVTWSDTFSDRTTIPLLRPPRTPA